MLILELQQIFQDQAHIFQDTYFQTFQIHQLTIKTALLTFCKTVWQVLMQIKVCVSLNRL